MDKRKLLLNTALELFVEGGFHNTPTSKIAQKAGVANGTLFHYFPSKEKLIVALYLDIKEDMSCFLTENTQIEQTIKETLKRQYMAMLLWAIDHRNEFHFIEQFKSSPFFSLVPEEETEKYLKPFIEMITKGMNDNTIKTMPVDLFITLINSHIYGVNHYLAINQFSKVTEHQLITESYELLWDMIS